MYLNYVPEPEMVGGKEKGGISGPWSSSRYKTIQTEHKGKIMGIVVW